MSKVALSNVWGQMPCSKVAIPAANPCFKPHGAPVWPSVIFCFSYIHRSQPAQHLWGPYEVRKQKSHKLEINQQPWWPSCRKSETFSLNLKKSALRTGMEMTSGNLSYFSFSLICLLSIGMCGRWHWNTLIHQAQSQASGGPTPALIWGRREVRAHLPN